MGSATSSSSASASASRSAPPGRAACSRDQGGRHLERDRRVEGGGQVDGTIEFGHSQFEFGGARVEAGCGRDGDHRQIDRWRRSGAQIDRPGEALHDGARRGDHPILRRIADQELHSDGVQTGSFELESIPHALADVGADLDRQRHVTVVVAHQQRPSVDSDAVDRRPDHAGSLGIEAGTDDVGHVGGIGDGRVVGDLQRELHRWWWWSALVVRRRAVWRPVARVLVLVLGRVRAGRRPDRR